MFKFLALLLIFGILGFFILGALLGRVIRFFGPANNKTGQRRTSSSRTSQNNSQGQNIPQKRFSKEEGEYVNYEEVREED